MIKSPFNFIPLSNKVFFPAWGKDVEKGISLDVPYKNGISGSINVEIEAETPIFVKEGEGKSKMAGDQFFQTPDGHYFIPGTSVKGCIRSVMEIMSFCKMRVDKDAAFAQRDWSNTTLYPLKTEQRKMKCGWLCRSKSGNDYVLKVCKGAPLRINLRRIDEWLEEKVFETRFSVDFKSKFDLKKPQKLHNEEYDPKTARFKYALLREMGIDIQDLKDLSFSIDNEYTTETTNRYNFDEYGEITGTLVFTGQPDYVKNWRGSRNKGDGKFYEFIFQDKIEKEITISESTFLSYDYIYKDSEDWKEWKNQLDEDGIPVFFRLSKSGTIIDLGLALLYKLPYENTPAELESRRYNTSDGFKPDMAECIFGYAVDSNAQRGRVQFSHFISQNAELDNDYTLVLNSPKASYYPMYIRQEKGRGENVTEYQTYNDGQLAGWKRYYLRDNVWVRNMQNPNVDSHLNPLKPGSVFNGKILFHNLLPQELGALLASLTFFDNPDCRHQIGQAKSYGFGRVKLKVNKNQTFTDNSGKDISFDYALATFEKVLRKDGIFLTTEDSIMQLITMSQIPVANTTEFEYMNLDVTNRKNEFTDAKDNKMCLPIPSGKLGKLIRVPSKYELLKSELDEEEQKAEEEAKQRKEEEERRKLEEEERRKIEEEQKRIEEQKQMLKEKYGTSLLSILESSKYVSTELAKWCKTEGNVFGDAEYGILRQFLSTKDKKELAVILKKGNEFKKAIGEDYWVKIRNEFKS